MNKKAVVILSGGMDSTTLVYDLHSRGYELFALSFNYGQKHARELIKAMVTTAKLSIPHEVVDLSHLSYLLKSSLTDATQQVPEGHYSDDNMKSTVVPNRNMIMLSIALGYAVTVGADTVAYGAHAGDHAIYPDCRPGFVREMSKIAEICHFDPIKLWAPYLNISKNEIAILAKGLRVPLEDTWTCYVGGENPCGNCGSCVERAEAVAFAGMEDPLCKTV
jgi:7-cyano-7-deazaguanine synthase